MDHMLTIEKNYYTGGFSGYCDCSDPDWTDDGWDGQVWFEGLTQQEVIDLHHDHVIHEEQS